MRRDGGPKTAPALQFGETKAPGFRGYLAVAVQVLLFPAGVALLTSMFVIVPAADNSVGTLRMLLQILVYVVVLPGGLFLWLGIVAWSALILWRSRGRPLCGVAIFPQEQPAMVKLVSRTGVRYRPLSHLHGIEVRQSSDFVSDHDKNPTPQPWLRLAFRNPATGRTTRYLITPDFYARGPAATPEQIADRLRELAAQ